ncbi:DUF3365 domain-containing protein [Pricia sp. S334]|uniref:DUF3365 domain-containing protein n=1 Tax=Pricia mediterranea TaxID=3076079 RepID=A0ABU3L2F8_9FLAO|nr:DUF3365 domain-containing protein [Pricia sp. S334]MDT7827476.1 DUF3365 domain-containing protein [Pricia sp. S334]
MRRTKILPVIALAGLFSFTGCKEASKSDKKVETVGSPSKDYAEIGMEYAVSTKAALGKNLVGAIQEKGTLGALEFCNIQAMPLTDSMAVAHKAIIKRVSDKPRNPNNQANAKELEYIEAFKSTVASGKKVEPIVNQENDQVDFYYPITTNTMCLQCHGKPEEQIEPATMAKLQDLYPEDQAIGYTENEVRGIWAIVVEGNKE